MDSRLRGNDENMETVTLTHAGIQATFFHTIAVAIVAPAQAGVQRFNN